MSYFIGVEIEINHHCNLACPYCPNSVTERSEKGLMGLKDFEFILNQLKEINYEGKICYHFYNEPLLHPQLSQFVSLSKTLLPRLNLKFTQMACTSIKRNTQN